VLWNVGLNGKEGWGEPLEEFSRGQACLGCEKLTHPNTSIALSKRSEWFSQETLTSRVASQGDGLLGAFTPIGMKSGLTAGAFGANAKSHNCSPASQNQFV